MGNRKSNLALERIADFIRSISDTGSDAGKDKFAPEIIFSYRDEATIMLSGEEAQQYRQCLALLINTTASDEIISSKAIEKLFQKAMLTSLDISGRRSDQTFEERIQRSLQTLITELRKKPTTHRVYYPIRGLATDGLPMKIGKVNFCVFDKENLDKFREIIESSQVDDAEKQRRYDLLDLISEDLIGHSIGIVEVDALEEEAAGSLALKEIRLTLDAINFYSDLIPYSQGYVYLPGEVERTFAKILSFVTGDQPKYHFQAKSVGPLTPLSLKNLIDTDMQKNLGLSRVSDILQSERNPLDDRLLAAIQWAGRATIDQRDEEAFLLYAIALESLVLVEGDREELGYRLRTRIAHLVGKNLDSRIAISKQIRDLYIVRSKIVHSGKYQVTDADLSQIRYFAKTCILRLLNEEPFGPMKRIQDLVDWFDKQILWSPAENET